MPVNLFDANFYRAAHSDLANFNDAQLQSHFQNYGLNEGRRFSSFVDLNFYRASHSDLANFSNTQAYQHLQIYGVGEGRKFSPFVDLNFYRANNSDLTSFQNEQLLNHLQTYGVGEGRKFSPFVDLNFYRSNNQDLASFNNNQALQHLELYGLNEERRFSPFVDLNLYRAVNTDLLVLGWSPTQLFQHLVTFGVKEGRRFSISFDSNYYRNIYSDLAAAGLNNVQLLEHFQKHGLEEGRNSSESFHVTYYLENHSDLKNAGFNKQQAQQHFEIHGFFEGRLAAPLNSMSPLPDRDDNSLGRAFHISVLNGNRNFTNQFVGSSDRNDFYHFTIVQPSHFNISLSHLSDYADMELIFDSNSNGIYDSGELLYDGYGNSYENGSLHVTLGTGNYFIRIFTDSSENNTNYTLGVTATPVLRTTPRDPGSTFSTAIDIGTLTTKRSFTDFVGSADRNDYYRFSISQTSNFNLSLTGLSSYADVELLMDSNNNGVYDSNEKLYYTYGSAWSHGTIYKILEAGTYFIRVYTADFGDNTNYTVEMTT
jgi:hypothetical protein